MTYASDIRARLERQPFESFLIRMTDDQSYEVANPALAIAMLGVLFLATPKRDGFKLLSYQNMTRVESQTRAG